MTFRTSYISKPFISHDGSNVYDAVVVADGTEAERLDLECKINGVIHLGNRVGDSRSFIALSTCSRKWFKAVTVGLEARIAASDYVDFESRAGYHT